MTTFNPDDDYELSIDSVLSLSDDGTTVTITFADVPVVLVDDLFMLLGTEEARDELLMKLAICLANQAANDNEGFKRFMGGNGE